MGLCSRAVGVPVTPTSAAGKGGTGPPNGLAPFLEREAPGIREEAAGSSGRTPGAGPELFTLGPGETTHQGQLYPDGGTSRVC